ncbi:MAG TPA: CinA family protein [Candidatus Thermoplasmatota archaeon]|nr:CinA family protein [Candidatus Thermoplasmatota archaeon]
MSLEERVLEALRREKLTLACAESCTGGLFGARLTTPSGASDVFQGGVICYQDEVKAAILHVDRKLLAEKGGVTAEAARQMATGARELLGTDIAISITGFAGPKVPPGGELGRVYIGVAHAGGVEVHELHFPDAREAVRAGAAERALEYVLDVVPRAAKARS